MLLSDRLSWFAGDRDALDLFERLVYIAHTWDDLIDRDKPVSSATINNLMVNLLLSLPGNPFYKRYEGEMRALVLVGITGYQAANIMEASQNEHQTEIAHYLRYAVVSLVTFMLAVIHGVEGGAAALAKIAPELINERLADYMKEHGHAAQ